MRIRHQRGGTLVEAAIVLPLLFMFLFAIIEFGRAFNMYQTMTNAAREGARFGVAPCQSGDTEQEACFFEGERFDSGYLPAMTTVTRFVNQYLAAANMQSVSTVVVNRPTPVPQTFTVNGVSHTRSYHYLTVDITASYDWLFFPFPDLALHANSVMKYEDDLEP
ncbi:MAG TPA: TadE/TadG family type IV pilus assembly protein [Terriglobales bacterium]|nr:TadE/TadG family type IV pilus assembly protein [Terriglobales bacterium]